MRKGIIMFVKDFFQSICTLVRNGKEHFITIHEHRKLVRQGCFRVGLYWQGICHDLSKYTPEEFFVGMKYYQGYRSPNNAEREAIGYSSAWLHHKGRNKHHYEYWLDYSSRVECVFIPSKMPNKYLVEMYMDRIAASKTYNKENYTDDFPLEYFLKGKGKEMIEESTAKELEHLLTILANKGEDATVKYIRKNLLKGRPGTYISWCFEKLSKRISLIRKHQKQRVNKNGK